MLPGQSFSLTSLQVTGGIFFFHFLVHLIAISIDPAEASVRLLYAVCRRAPHPTPPLATAHGAYSLLVLGISF